MTATHERLAQVLASSAAEEALLGAAIVDNEVLSWADLDRALFCDPRNRAMYDAMVAIAGDGMPIDVVTLENALQRLGTLESVGGVPRISELALATPDSRRAKAYATQLEELRVGRDLALLASQALRDLEREEPGEVLSDLMRKASALDRAKAETTFVLGDAVRAEWRRMNDDLASGSSPAAMMRTGLAGLDEVVGGLPIGIPSLLGAPPSTGKSALALSIARFAGEHDQGAAVFTYEDREYTWAQRVLAEASGVPASDIRRRQLDRESLRAVNEAAERMRSIRNVVIEHAHGVKAYRTIRRARALRRRFGMRLFIVDFMQLIPNPDSRQFKTRADAVGENLRLWADFAGEDDVAVLMLWQLTRDFEKSKAPPHRTDFADSSAAERYGKFNLAIWEPPDAGDDIELVIVKNNNGALGKWRLPFNRPVMRIG